TEWTNTPTDHILINFLVGRWSQLADYRANGVGPMSSDTVTLQNWGAITPNQTPRDRVQYIGSLTYFKPNFFGSHDVKVGGEFTHEYAGSNNASRPAELLGGDVAYQYQNGVPFQVVLQNLPTRARNKMNTQSMYVKDSWKMGERLTVNAGVRVERFHLWV